MNEFFTGILESSQVPWLSAMMLGLLTAISPCPLATNITAIGFISKDIENRNRASRMRMFFIGLNFKPVFIYE